VVDFARWFPEIASSAMTAKSSGAIANRLQRAATKLRSQVNQLSFGGDVEYVYNPLDYAWAAHKTYINRFGASPKKILFLGMNPGPFGMMQTGIPFGEVAAVRDWMGIQEKIKSPAVFHPKRPIQGFECTRAEVSGKRLWSWAADRYGSAEQFFADRFVLNYCPLVFLGSTGRNLTPDKLPAAELAPLQAACDAHLLSVIDAINPNWALGVGGYAARRLSLVTGNPIETDDAKDESTGTPRIGQILHPSPASPIANRGWAPAAEKQLAALNLL